MATIFSSIACVSLTSIDGTDCIGDSRKFINQNIENLGTTTCTLLSVINTLQVNTTALSANLQTVTAVTTSLSASFNPNNCNPLSSLGTLVSSLSVFNAQGAYIGYLPIYI